MPARFNRPGYGIPRALADFHPVGREAWLAFMDAPEATVAAYVERRRTETSSRQVADLGEPDDVRHAQVGKVPTRDAERWPAKNVRAIHGGVVVPVG